jgi:hypothetical protein
MGTGIRSKFFLTRNMEELRPIERRNDLRVTFPFCFRREPSHRFHRVIRELVERNRTSVGRDWNESLLPAKPVDHVRYEIGCHPLEPELILDEPSDLEPVTRLVRDGCQDACGCGDSSLLLIEGAGDGETIERGRCHAGDNAITYRTLPALPTADLLRRLSSGQSQHEVVKARQRSTQHRTTNLSHSVRSESLHELRVH